MNVTPPTLLMVVLAVLSTFLIGGLWYSPVLFGRAWQQAVGLSDQTLRATAARTFVVAGVVALVVGTNLGFFIGGKSTLSFGAFAGVATGVFMAGAVVTTSSFARRPARLIAIDAGYHLLSAAVAGTIIGALGEMTA